MNDQKDPNWLTSDEARRALRISSCELMHLRLAGKLRFSKKGNSFFYKKDDVQKVLKKS